MPTNWSDKAVQDRLLLAIIASVDAKLNLAEVARLYGNGMTYDAIEGRLRKTRKEAKALKENEDGRTAAASMPAKRKKQTGVKTGRVTKQKKTAAVKVPVKKELSDEDDGAFGDVDSAFAVSEIGEEV